MANIAFTKKSSNKKVGPIPVTTSSKTTCPASCPMLENGCYASAGFHTNMHWNKVTSGERGTDVAGFCDILYGCPEFHCLQFIGGRRKGPAVLHG